MERSLTKVADEIESRSHGIHESGDRCDEPLQFREIFDPMTEPKIKSLFTKTLRFGTHRAGKPLYKYDKSEESGSS